ncbi:IS5/IS1182 family transposase, partial [Acidithiobacillus caldus]
MIARRTAVTNDLLADDGYIQKVDAIGDPLQKIEAVVDFSALA